MFCCTNMYRELYSQQLNVLAAADHAARVVDRRYQ